MATPEAVQAIATALQQNQNLTALHAAWNEIGFEGALCFALALEWNQTLTTLGIDGNGFGPEGAQFLAAAPLHRRHPQLLGGALIA